MNGAKLELLADKLRLSPSQRLVVCLFFVFNISGCANLPPPGSEIGIVASSPAFVTVFGRSKIPGALVLIGPDIPIATDQQMTDLAQSHCAQFEKNALLQANTPVSGGRKTTFACVTQQAERRDSERVDMVKKPESTSGTGFFITHNGVLLTNHHLAKDCQILMVTDRKRQSSVARVHAIDPINDLALLKVDREVDVIALFRALPNIRQGDDVIVFGFPLGGAIASGGALTKGTVTALSGLGADTRVFQMSAQVHPGNSGGPVFDTNGSVVGVVVSKLNALMVAKITGDIPQNVNFAIKSNVVRGFLEANEISYNEKVFETNNSVPNIAEQARKIAVEVSCVKK